MFLVILLFVCLFHSFTLTPHFDKRYAGYHNCNYPCMSIYTVPLRANDLRASSRPVVAYLPWFPVLTAPLGPRLRNLNDDSANSSTALKVLR